MNEQVKDIAVNVVFGVAYVAFCATVGYLAAGAYGRYKSRKKAN